MRKANRTHKTSFNQGGLTYIQIYLQETTERQALFLVHFLKVTIRLYQHYHLSVKPYIKNLRAYEPENWVNHLVA